MRIHHLALRCENLSASLTFYRDLLGLPELLAPAPRATEGEKRSVWLRAGETVLMLETRLRGPQEDTSEKGSAHVLAFAVEDLARWEEKLQAAGVPIDDRTEATLYLRDPEGRRVGLSRYRFEAP